MRHYNFTQKNAARRGLRPIMTPLIALIVIIIICLGFARHAYVSLLGPVSKDQTTQIFTVVKGSSVKMIAADLEKDHLIRSAWAMQWYVHSQRLSSKVQAGSYAVAPNQGTKQIVDTLTGGHVSTRLVTILPGRRIDQVRADLINDGFAPAAVDHALDPSQYAGLPVLAFKPANISTLEGLLWPDSYQKDATTSPEFIIKESLIAMGEHVTPEVQAGFAAHGLTTYQGLILASIINQEVSKPADQAQAAQVFMTRLKTGVALGSDVTAKYGAVIAGRAPSVTYESAYSTSLHVGLPPGPVSTVSASSLQAATHPTNTNWTFFVAGDDGTTYFSNTLAEHQALTQKYCHKLCGQ